MNILVCDDDKEIAGAIEIYLRNEGYTVFKAFDGIEALNYARNQQLHLIIMDVMMPKMDGVQATMKIREEKNIPIIMLSAKSEDYDKITGLNVGADDYITKPFNPLEVLARVKTQLRRYTRYNVGKENAKESAESLNEIDIRGLHISRDNHKCLLNGTVLTLTPTEFDILWYLCTRRGSVVSSEELFEAVWGERYLDNNNTVMTHIARLREKMNEPPRRPKYIRTIWGVGYTIE